jgi:dCTP deaminase
MSLLAYNQLCDIVDAGIMTHVQADNINSASIDVRIGNKILVERTMGSIELHTISLAKREPLKVIEHNFTKDGPFYLYPGECILAHTIEMFNLPNNLSAMFKLKSSCGRIFLEHMNAGWCDAGWHGSSLTMELKNNSRNHCIELNLGDKIGQMVFFSHPMVPDDKSYATRGRYNKDKEVSGAKPAIIFGEESDDIAQQVYEETIAHVPSVVEQELDLAKMIIVGEQDD